MTQSITAGRNGQEAPRTPTAIESFWTLFRRSLNGTWYHVSPKHLHRYVNEATMRLNIGKCEIDTIDRVIAFAHNLGNHRISHKDLIA